MATITSSRLIDDDVRACGEGWVREQAVGSGDDVTSRWAAKRAIRVSTGECIELAKAGVESLQFCKRGDAVVLQGVGSHRQGRCCMEEGDGHRTARRVRRICKMAKDGWVSCCKRAMASYCSTSDLQEDDLVVLQDGWISSCINNSDVVGM